ncbi:MAG TPA: DNA polymerase IV [Kofleriaceae bacterium]|nr:DNA polymerase IV [Kofleriaceae bacterium]
MNDWPRTILHVDLDAFFAAVEQRDDPSLRGKPVVVGGSVARGVVAAASYEARRYGVFSAMPMAEAMRRCPHAIVVPHRFDRYQDASRQFFDILSHYSPLVESLSLDEAFVDVTASRRLFGDGVAIAHAIKARVREEIELVASIGVAPIKFAAKIGSDIDKPDGLRVIPPDQLLRFLHALPVSRLWGAGAVTQDKLREMGLETIGDVARYPVASLSRRLGPSLGAHLAALARGEDSRDVVTDGEPVSIGHEETFDVDLASHEELTPHLLSQADRVASRLRAANLRARVVVVKVKHADFRLVSRRRTLDDPTSDGDRLGKAAVEHARDVDVGDHGGKRTRVRLCGVSVSGLEQRDAPRQLALDEATRQRGERLGDTLDAVRARFGKAAVVRAIHTGDADDD